MSELPSAQSLLLCNEITLGRTYNFVNITKNLQTNLELSSRDSTPWSSPQLQEILYFSPNWVSFISCLISNCLGSSLMSGEAERL